MCDLVGVQLNRPSIQQELLQVCQEEPELRDIFELSGQQVTQWYFSSYKNCQGQS